MKLVLLEASLKRSSCIFVRMRIIDRFIRPSEWFSRQSLLNAVGNRLKSDGSLADDQISRWFSSTWRESLSFALDDCRCLCRVRTFHVIFHRIPNKQRYIISNNCPNDTPSSDSTKNFLAIIVLLFHNFTIFCLMLSCISFLFFSNKLGFSNLYKIDL